MTITPPQDRRAGSADARTRRWAWPIPWIEPPGPEPDSTDPDGQGRHLSSRPTDRRTGAAVAHVATGRGPSALLRLFVEQGQSPWLDHLSRGRLVDGSLSQLVTTGIRGITANPAALARALDVTTAYDEQLSWLFSTGCTAEEAYRELAASDVLAACAILRSVYETSQGEDGFVSIEVAPTLADRTRGAVAGARRLHQRIARPNLLVAIPATGLGIPAIRAAISSGRNINATSIFSISRYSAVIDAYLSGLETFIDRGGDPATIHGVASFSLRPVDTEVDSRLESMGGSRALALRGLAAVAQAKLAYRLFEDRFSTDRWARLTSRGARPQRLLWASSDTDDVGQGAWYVDELVAPHTVHTLSESAVAALTHNGVGRPTLDVGVREAAGVLSDLAQMGIDLDDVGLTLEKESSAHALHSLGSLLDRLSAKRGPR